jgi:hypothetical protein
MVAIVITPEVVGRAKLYEFRDRQGRRRMVPAYKAVASDGPTYFEFAVTRDSSAVIFGNDPPTDRFGTKGECPPSRFLEPYYGRVRQDGKAGFSIQLFEPDCPLQETLCGQGTTERKHVLIHHGPGASEGCFMVAGGKEGYHRFRQNVEPILSGSSIIKVTVLPRML